MTTKEAIEVLKDMKIETSLPKAAVTQRKRNAAIDVAIEALNNHLADPGKKVSSSCGQENDPVSRKAAIDAIEDYLDEYSGLDEEGYHGEKWCAMAEAKMVIENLPSTQPEPQHGRIFQEIVVEHPSISTYTEYEGKPYFSIKYTENGQEFIGYGTYKPEVLSGYLKDYFMPSAQPEPKWIPCSERLPEKKDTCFYLATIANHGLNFTTTLPDDVDVVRWDYDRRKGHNSWHWCTERTVIAWMPLPEPYQAERREK